MSVNLLGFDIDNYTFDEALDKAKELMFENSVSQVVTINPEMFKEAEVNSEFAAIINDAEMVIPDGVGVKIALKLKGKDVERIAGIDFAWKLLDYSNINNVPVAIIGAKEEVVQKAVNNIKNKFDNINIVYYRNGYFNDNNEVYNELINSSPKLVLVALGSPKQEEFIYGAKKVLNPALMVGIGGSLDVWSGTLKRAPKIVQKLGIEWLYRTICQPSRFKRIFPTLPLFLLKVIMYKDK